MPVKATVSEGTTPIESQISALLSRVESFNYSIRRSVEALRNSNQHERFQDGAIASRDAVDDLKPVEPSFASFSDAREKLKALDAELQRLEEQEINGLFAERERSKPQNGTRLQDGNGTACTKESVSVKTRSQWQWPLSQEEYQRYGRQLIMPEIGLQGQLRLHNSSVVIVGVGGLGCPAAAYLAGAGVGTIGLVDGDTVEASNLHRQILHSTSKVGWKKVESAIETLRDINPLVTYKSHGEHLTPEDALSIFSQYDLILDCTDHPTSRYLISDAAVLLNKPLVSASALKTDGQLTTLNNPPADPGNPEGGPCYRCIFPKPPPPESVVSCGEGGILGPVVGVMGVLQALEAIKVITAPTIARPKHTGYSESSNGTGNAAPPAASLLVFSAFSPQPFRSVRLRGRKPGCAACSTEATVSKNSLASGSMDYVQFCGALQPVDILSPEERMTVDTYAAEREETGSLSPGKGDILLLDVREKAQFELCSLPESINIPYSELSSWRSADDAAVLRDLAQDKQSVRFICRLGNDSQFAVRKTKELGIWSAENVAQEKVAHIDGGFKAWKRDVDPTWPDY